MNTLTTPVELSKPNEDIKKKKITLIALSIRHQKDMRKYGGSKKSQASKKEMKIKPYFSSWLKI
jgi:hypothetical protein